MTTFRATHVSTQLRLEVILLTPVPRALSIICPSSRNIYGNPCSPPSRTAYHTSSLVSTSLLGAISLLPYSTPLLTIDRFMTGADGLENIPHREWLVVFDRILSEVKEYSKQQGNDFVGAKVRCPSFFESNMPIQSYVPDHIFHCTLHHP